MMLYVRLLRPAQWVKNVFVFAALAFGNKMGDAAAIQESLLAFGIFCLASSAGYIINDIFDRERDRHHPTKKNRPLASGDISLRKASIVIALLVVVVFAACHLYLPTHFSWVIGTYLALTVTYSLGLKHRMLLDVILIAVLFVLRAVGGAVAIQVPVSPWLLVCTFMLCLFIGFGKRRCEITALGSVQALQSHRPTLLRYTPDLLTHLLSTSAGIAIITFVLYTLDKTWESPFHEHRQNLLYTLPLVVYGIYRYAMLVELGKGDGPTDLIMKDRPFLLTIVLWCISAVVILYKGAWLSALVPMG